MKYFICLILLTICGVANAGNVTITWQFDASSTATCVDGTPAATNCPVQSFVVEQQTNNIWTAKSPHLSGSLRSHTYTGIAAGRHCFRLKANSNGTLSAASNEVCLDVPPSAPKAPTITVTIAVGSPST